MLENRNGIPSRRVIDVMERLIAVYGEPEMVLTDNGPEFISKVYKSWADKRGIKLCYIDLGEPMQKRLYGKTNNFLFTIFYSPPYQFPLKNNPHLYRQNM